MPHATRRSRRREGAVITPSAPARTGSQPPLSPLSWLLQEHRPRLHLLAVAIGLWLATPTWQSALGGLLLALPGMAWRFWAMGYLDKEGGLATGGPYALIRHPLYLGNMVVLAGLCLATNNPWLGAAGITLGALMCAYLVRIEDRSLAARFGDAFAEYRRRTPAVLPGLARRLTASPTRFSWRLTRQNGVAYQYLLVLGVFALVAAKAIWLTTAP